MNTTMCTDEVVLAEPNSPGSQLSTFRQQKGFTQEYVASKLHLRVRIIQLIEADDYEKLPEPVFVKGYLRAYAKLLGVNHEPILNLYKTSYMTEAKTEKALWQSTKKEPVVRAEKYVRLVTGLFATAVVVAVAVWWQQHSADTQVSAGKEPQSELALNKVNPEVRLTDLSKMQSLFSTQTASNLSSTPEKKVE